MNGIILTGDNDLASQANNLPYRLREKHEKSLIKYSINNSILILGVCRGMQLIAEYFGSMLKKNRGHIATRHKIASVNQDKYIEYIDKKEYVNSYHAYSIDAIGDDLNLVGICPQDDVIEAIVHKEHKIFGQIGTQKGERPFEPNDCDFIYSFLNA